jgi:hypothetical protein
MTLELSKNGIVAGWHRQTRQQSLASQTSGGMAEKLYELADATRSAGQRSGDGGKPLDKRLARTSLVAASPTSHPQLKGDWRALDRKILQLQDMPAVSRIRRHRAVPGAIALSIQSAKA